MDRRNFIKTGSVAGLTLTTLAAASCNPASPDKKQEDNAVGKPDDFELNEVTIDTLQQKMQSKAYTSRSITELYLKRIDAIDKNGPKINSVIELNPDALDIADAMDKERAAGKVRGPLHGIPVLIKDNITTGDKMHTTAGALAIADNIMKEDAFIIKKLREAGAVLLGKTNLSEWANFRSTRSTSAWSSVGARCSALTRSATIASSAAAGSNCRCSTAVPPRKCAPRPMNIAPMWNSGMTFKARSAAVKASEARTFFADAQMLRCASGTKGRSSGPV